MVAAMQASLAEIKAGALSTEKLRRLVEGFDARGCTYSHHSRTTPRRSASQKPPGPRPAP